MTFASLARALEALQSAQLVVDDEMCINPRGRRVLCRRCEKACPAAALTLCADEIALDEAACTACGACIPACPAGALRLTGYDPERFLQAIGHAPEVHVHCSASRDAGGGVVIPCHMLLDARLLAAAMAEGTGTFVLHGLGGCSTCPRGDATGRVASVRRLLQRWFGDGTPALLVATSGDRAPAGQRVYRDQPEASRRGFLRLAGLQAGASTAWSIPGDGGDGHDETTPAWHSLAAERAAPQRPVPQRQALTERMAGLSWATPRLPWAVRAFAERCTGCMACAQCCPTGALHGEATSEVRRITFDPALCTNCTLCQRICPEDAVRPRSAATVAEVIAPRSLLMYQALQPCAGCGLGFVPDEGPEAFCVQCRNERELDDEWLAMLEA